MVKWALIVISHGEKQGGPKTTNTEEQGLLQETQILLYGLQTFFGVV